MQIRGNVSEEIANVTWEAVRFACVHLGLPTAAISKIQFRILACKGEYNIPTKEIHIDKTLPLDQIVSTIFHEATHANQAYQGTLTFNEGVTYWAGVKIQAKGLLNHPCEVQARKSEQELMQLWARRV